MRAGPIFWPSRGGLGKLNDAGFCLPACGVIQSEAGHVPDDFGFLAWANCKCLSSARRSPSARVIRRKMGIGNSFGCFSIDRIQSQFGPPRMRGWSCLGWSFMAGIPSPVGWLMLPVRVAHGKAGRRNGTSFGMS